MRKYCPCLAMVCILALGASSLGNKPSQTRQEQKLLDQSLKALQGAWLLIETTGVANPFDPFRRLYHKRYTEADGFVLEFRGYIGVRRRKWQRIEDVNGAIIFVHPSDKPPLAWDEIYGLGREGIYAIEWIGILEVKGDKLYMARPHHTRGRPKSFDVWGDLTVLSVSVYERMKGD